MLAWLQAPDPAIIPELLLERSAHRWEWEKQWLARGGTLGDDLAAYKAAGEVEVLYFDAGQIKGFCIPVLHICEAYTGEQTGGLRLFESWRWAPGRQCHSALAEFVKRCGAKLAAERAAPVRPAEPGKPVAPSDRTRYFDPGRTLPPPDPVPDLAYRTLTLRWKPRARRTEPPREVLESLRQAVIQTVSGRRLGCGPGYALIPQFALEDSDVVVFFYSGPGSDEAGCNQSGIIFFQSTDGRQWFANQFTFRPDEVAWFSGRISERLLLTVQIE